MEERPEQRYHRPVLLEQTIEALDIRPDGVYLDGTAGGGGHSFAIASRITTGRLIALDRDPDAVKEAGQRLQGLPAAVVQANFTQMAQVLESLGVDGVDGVLLDIGVSSHQLDEAGRGFSYHMEAPLDMRMSQSGVTAADLVNSLTDKELADILFRYGEEKYAWPIAREILRRAGGRADCDHHRSWRISCGKPCPPPIAGTVIPPARPFRRCASRSTANWTACPPPWTPRSTA